MKKSMLAILGILTCFAGVAQAGPVTPKVRTYYIAADEVDWDYAPGGVNKMMGMKFEGYSKVFTERGPHRIGTVYRKALYREYTDETFTQLKPRPAQWEHTGILGPILRAEVGDTIRVVFKNNATRPYSMHPHGVFYDKDSEGAGYDDGTSGADKGGRCRAARQDSRLHLEGAGARRSRTQRSQFDRVALSLAHQRIPGCGERAGRRHHRHAARHGRCRRASRRMSTANSSASSCSSTRTRAGISTTTFRPTPAIPRASNKDEFKPVDDDGNFFGLGSGFIVANFKFSINGYMYGTGPMMTMKKGERVRWYLVSLGEAFSFHTPHWHGNVVLQDGKRTDVVSLMQAQMVTVDMVPDNPGTWMFHCHIDDHMDAGMSALYKVEP